MNPKKFIPLLPGALFTALLAVAAWGLQIAETRWLGHPIIEALVIAILLGMIWRNLAGVAAPLAPGVQFSAKTVLEIAVVLLGAAVDLPALFKGGPALLGMVALAVTLSLIVSSLVGRLCGLGKKLATLVAVGNSICGNSAIAAVAPVIGAEPGEIASSIALTAVLGVAVVLTLPLLIPLLHLNHYQYGVLAGMSVYAVPQVLAATLPVSAVSGEIGTLVKLVRVLLLGPVVFFYSLRSGAEKKSGASFRLTNYIPGFILGFMILALLRSTGLLNRIVLPAGLAPLPDQLREISRWLTVAAMAALGLGVDLKAVGKVGPRVALAVLGSLIFLISLSAGLILLLKIGVA
jgi:uncharacterized integral membrane protein (TIGR00698 family)